MTTLSVIVASKGRDHLKLTLASIGAQLQPGDELIVDVNDDAPWGHKARNRRMIQTRGDALLFIDDDDTYRPGAFETIRSAFASAPDRLHVFQMRYRDGRTIWKLPVLRSGDVSTQMIAVPRSTSLPLWGSEYDGDWTFIEAMSKLVQPQFHRAVIVNAGLFDDVQRP